MSLEAIKNIRDSKIRIFPFQTRDRYFILYNELQSSYLLTLLIDKIGFSQEQFAVDYILPFENYLNYTLRNIEKYKEEYFIFYAENYYHSNDYAIGFIEKVISYLDSIGSNKKVIVYTLKTPKEECIKLISKYKNIFLILNTDIEYFFLQIFFKNQPIEELPNIIYRDDNGDISFTHSEGVDYDLSEYIIGGYYNGYYTSYLPNKDYLISMADDNGKGDIVPFNRDEYIETLRHLPGKEAMITTGRGCKYKCSYCYRGVKYSKLRQIPLDIIKKDLDYLSSQKYEYIYIYDDCFVTTNFDRISEIIDLLSKYDFIYGIAARYEVCSPGILEKLSILKIKRIQVGLQSSSSQVNQQLKRGFDESKFGLTVKRMSALGIDVSLDLILGLPGEGLKGFIQTFHYALSLAPVSIFINILFLNPGTELYEKREQYGITVKSQGNGIDSLFHTPQVSSSNTFSYEDILIAKKYITYYAKKVKNIRIILR